MARFNKLVSNSTANDYSGTAPRPTLNHVTRTLARFLLGRQQVHSALGSSAAPA
jgi:hypothetical protein